MIYKIGIVFNFLILALLGVVLVFVATDFTYVTSEISQLFGIKNIHMYSFWHQYDRPWMWVIAAWYVIFFLMGVVAPLEVLLRVRKGEPLRFGLLVFSAILTFPFNVGLMVIGLFTIKRHLRRKLYNQYESFRGDERSHYDYDSEFDYEPRPAYVRNRKRHASSNDSYHVDRLRDLEEKEYEFEKRNESRYRRQQEIIENLEAKLDRFKKANKRR